MCPPPCLFRSSEFFRRLGITQLVCEEIDRRYSCAVFRLALPQVVEQRTPPGIMFKILSHMFGEQNVSRVAAIHHTLRDVYSSAGNIRLLVKISDFTDRATVNSHSHFNFRDAF